MEKRKYIPPKRGATSIILPPKIASAEQQNKIQENPGKSVRSVLLKTAKLILLIHIVAYSVLISKQTIGRPHFIGKVLMVSALSLTQFYIVPLSKAFGYHNPLTKPLYLVRDTLYDWGWNVLPEDDAERYMWWVAIRFTTEYHELIDEDLNAYADGKAHKLTPAHYEAWTNEIYKNIEPLASLPLKDKYFQGVRLMSFIKVAHVYICVSANFLAKYHGVPDFAFRDNAEIQRTTLIYEYFIKLREYASRHEPIAFNEVVHGNNKAYWLLGNIFINQITSDLLYTSIVQRHEDIVCDDQLVEENVKARNALYSYFNSDDEIPPFDRKKEKKSHIKNGLFQYIQARIAAKCGQETAEHHIYK